MLPPQLLLVDDEVIFANNMARLLNNRGYQTTVVNSGQSALERLTERRFDVIVLDLKMPGLDGIATLRGIKDCHPTTEVLILTGHGAVDSALEAIKLGAYDYLAKPCEIEDLVAKIEAAFGRKDQLEKAEMEERIQRIIEWPGAVFEDSDKDPA